MKKKWSKFGKRWARISFVYQLCVCILVTILFMLTRPHLDHMERKWGMVDTWGGKLVHSVVVVKVAIEMIMGIVEFSTLLKINRLHQDEILKQCSDAKEHINGQSSKTRSYVHTAISVYFERSISLPREFRNLESKDSTYSYVTGLFHVIGYLSNICFIIAQGAAFFSGIHAARFLLISMIFIMFCEYVQLLLWLQTWSQVGRFISAVWNILQKDFIGFAIVFLIEQLVFCICFLLLAEEDDADHHWWRTFFIFYELSVGTGEWFKDKFDSIETLVESDSFVWDPDYTADDDFLEMDPCRKALLYIMYMIHICITLVILMNLLIAIMSETATSVAKEMHKLEKSLKLSSISLVSRRLRALTTVAHFFGFRRMWFGHADNTIAGATVKDYDLFEGRLAIKEKTASEIQKRIKKEYHIDHSFQMKDYFDNMRWWTVFEHERTDQGEDS